MHFHFVLCVVSVFDTELDSIRMHTLVLQEFRFLVRLDESLLVASPAASASPTSGHNTEEMLRHVLTFSGFRLS
jgi:hypothetical protein